MRIQADNPIAGCDVVDIPPAPSGPGAGFRRELGKTARRGSLVPWLGVLLLLGAGPPDAIRVRVPSAKVGAWFPPGTELRGMPASRFDALLQDAVEGARRGRESALPRLLRARHFARWDSGILDGRTELVVAPSPGGPSELWLSPWTPAIVPQGGGSAWLRMDDTGRTAVRVEAPGASSATITVPWQLRARASARGRGFTLGLPETETSRLTLDLPEGWIPEGPAGTRSDPERGPDAGRKTWRFDGRGGLVNLLLRDPAEERGALEEARTWVSGPTRIEVSESSATWVMDWTVDADRRGPRRLVVELDEGLEWLGASGPEVEGAQAESVGGRTRVTVPLNPRASGPSPVSFRATARVPAEGPWPIPSARPLDALWTGGRTIVRLDPSRVLTGCREAAGRRVPPRPGEAGEANLLVFESEAPAPVAVLTFGRPRVDASVEVRGQLLVGNSAPRLECQLTWRVHRGRLLALDVDLPPAWVPDRVGIAGLDEPVSWHPEVLAGGAVRVHVIPPSGDLAHNSPILLLAATASVAGGRGPLALPRVRPVGVAVADERWLARTEAGLTLVPASARGLAWIDPALVAGTAATRSEAPAGFRDALAWRWNSDQAEGRVDRERIESEPVGSVHLSAAVDRDRLRLDWRIAAEAGDEPLRTIPIGMSGPIGDAGPWRFLDERSGLDVVRRPLDAAGRAALGLPESGEGWELVLPRPRPGPVAIRAHRELAWQGAGRIPLLVLPESYRSRNLVLIEEGRDLRSTVEQEGLHRLDPTVVDEAFEAGRAGAGPRRRRPAHAFGYARPGGRLALRTEALEPARLAGVIDEAVLTTSVGLGGPSRHRLNLQVVADQGRSLELGLPGAVSPIEVRRDGQEVVPVRGGLGLVIALPAPTPSRPSCTISVEYLTPGPVPGGATILRPERPKATLPYLGFRWEVVVPRAWAVLEHGPALFPNDPGPSPASGPAWPLAWGANRLAWARQGSATRVEEQIAALDPKIEGLRAEEATLGEWLTRWDAGPRPLVVDRMALEFAGWGPRTRVSFPRIDSRRPASARSALRRLGLALVAVGDFLLVTTLAEAPDRPGGPFDDARTHEAWEAALRQAPAAGSDPSDRFQAVARWRGGFTPIAQVAGEQGDRGWLGEGRRIWRFSAVGWPESGVTLRLVDERSQAAWTCAAALAVLMAGIAGRHSSRRVRSMAPGLVLAAAAGMTIYGPVEYRASATGASAGALAVVFFWLGHALPRPTPGRSRESRDVAARRPLAGGPRIATAAWLTASLAVAGLSTRIAAAPPGSEDPILALFPYDGPADPLAKPDWAILRLKDFERLKVLADSGRTGRSLGVTALDASHHVSRKGREVVVETELELEGPRDGPGVWNFPVDEARDISATLDGSTVPVLVQPGGRTASVAIPGSLRCRVKIRRVAAIRQNEDGEFLALAILPLAAARVVVEGVPEGRRVEVPGARGRIESKGGSVEGMLGPVDRLEVRWPTRDGGGAAGPPPTVEGLILWDAEPSGDHVRVRLTYRGPGPSSTIRLRLDPGLTLRAAAIPGLTDLALEGTSERPEWVAHVEPPLPDGATIHLEGWRPILAGRGPGPRSPGRSLPRLEPLGVERFSGAVGFRRPADWSGRLAPSAGVEAISEEAFVRAWGNLPPEPLTLSGATRFVRAAGVEVLAGPLPGRLVVQTTSELVLGPGRIDLDLKADLSESSGPVYQAELELPAGFRVNRVDADGLTDWSRWADRLRLRFDGPPNRQRGARVQGWLSVASNPLAVGTAAEEVAILWPAWRDAEARPGTLIVSARSPFLLDPTSGLSPVPPPSPPTGRSAGEPYRSAFRVTQAGALGTLRWQVEPPSVGVEVRSQLTVHPDSAEWVAVLRYDVSGGPCDAIHLKLPTAWAGPAEVTLVGDSHKLTAESRGATTYWSIRPERPIWGSRRVVIRSVRPLRRPETLVFPDLKPLGRGSVDTYLALVNATGREFAIEGAPGLQPVHDTTRFAAGEFFALPGVPSNVYHVRSEGWSLKVEAPAGTPAPSRVRLADLECLLLDDGSAQGSARYEAEARSGPFLSLALPEGAEPLWASVNNAPAHPLRAPSGRWLIPLEEAIPSVVNLVWRSGAGGEASGTPRQVPLPILDDRRAPLFVTVRTPGPGDLSSANGMLQRVGFDRLELTKAETLGQAIAEGLARVDRGSLRDRERLIAQLVRFELLLRSAERGAAWNPAVSSSVGARLEWVRQRAGVARTRLADATGAAGLDAIAHAAEVHLGRALESAGRPVPEDSEPVAPVRIDHLGRATTFQGDSGEVQVRPAVTWAAGRVPGWLDREGIGIILPAVVAFPVVLWILLGRRGPASRIAALGLALALAAVGGPLALGAALALAGLGRSCS